MKNIKRIAIFIDAHDFEEVYEKSIKKGSITFNEKIKMYEGLTKKVFDLLIKEDIPKGIKETYSLDHVGNYLAVPHYTLEDLIDADPNYDQLKAFLKGEKERRIYHRELDALQGFILRYVYPKLPFDFLDPKKSNGEKAKGVDAEIICQALIGAMSDDYDIACLVSDNPEYVPLVERIHGAFNKQVIQVGFKDDDRGVTRLQAACYGHIDLEPWT